MPRTKLDKEVAEIEVEDEGPKAVTFYSPHLKYAFRVRSGELVKFTMGTYVTSDLNTIKLLRGDKYFGTKHFEKKG